MSDVNIFYCYYIGWLKSSLIPPSESVRVAYVLFHPLSPPFTYAYRIVHTCRQSMTIFNIIRKRDRSRVTTRWAGHVDDATRRGSEFDENDSTTISFEIHPASENTKPPEKYFRVRHGGIRPREFLRVPTWIPATTSKTFARDCTLRAVGQSPLCSAIFGPRRCLDAAREQRIGEDKERGAKNGQLFEEGRKRANF